MWALREALTRVGADRVRLGRQRRTVDEIRGLAASLAVARGPCPLMGRPAMRLVGRGLVVVNAVALAVVLGRLEGAPAGPGWLSSVLALAVTGVQVGLAFDLGRRLLPFVGRETAAGLSVVTVVEAMALAGMQSLVGTASYRWATDVQDDAVGMAGGLVMLASAVVAPLMVVHDEVYGPGLRGRVLRRCERALGRVDRRCHRLDRRVNGLISSARRHLRRAEELLVLAADLLGDEDPGFARLDAEVARLRAAIADLDGLTPPLDPDDLDLAG